MDAVDSIACKIILQENTIVDEHAISGWVEISASEEIVIEQAFIEILGIAKCKWKLEKPLLKLPYLFTTGTIFSGTDNFYISRHKILTTDEATNAHHEGTKRYQFRCRIPANLPATWSGEYGSVTYTGRVVILMPKKTSFVYVQDIIIHSRRDLKLEQYLLCEARRDTHRTFHFAALSLGSVNVSVWLPLCGIAAGQGIPVLCSITNNSKILFGSLVFVLTKTEIYRSHKPVKTAKTVRTDICRVARVVDILKGRSDYYCILETTEDILPTNQFWRCKCCQITYEVWVSVQAALPRYNAYNYPNIDTPGIPVIIGTEPILKWNKDEVTSEVMNLLLSSHPPVIMEPPVPDDEVEEMLTHVEEELDEAMIQNLSRQMANTYSEDESDEET